MEKPKIVKRKGVVDDGEDDEEEDDRGRITERSEDVSRITTEVSHLHIG